MRKYLVIGAGGTGGPIGAYLAKGGKDVTFIARGENLKALKSNGIKVVRPEDEFIVKSFKASEFKDYSDTPDVVFVCVKGYSLDAVIPDLKRVAGKNTIIIPILNGFGTGEKLQKNIPDSLVTDGCTYVAAELLEPGVIKMNGGIFRVIYGVRDKADYRDELKDIEKELNECDILGILSDNIVRDVLVKFSYVSPAGACGLYLNVVSGDMQKPGEARDLFAGLISEVAEIGKAMGIEFEEDLVERNLKIMDSLVDTATTSMQRDVNAGRQSEIDGLVFEVVRLADKYGVKAPLYRKVAEALGGSRGRDSL
ncbi:MAG: 2-dehydropantoate 2-reductase [Lachnospiraceae bacterium]|nr:2-dehydropantoate 2-reductase [Lachnospiraceae bacterium]